MVLHLDEEEEVDEDAEETWEEEGYGDDEKQQFAAAAADDDRGEARNRESVAIDVEGRVGGVSDCGLDFSFRSYPESFDRYAGLSSPEVAMSSPRTAGSVSWGSPSGSPRDPSRGARWRSWPVRCSNSTSRA